MDGSWGGESVLKLTKCKDSAASASHLGAFGLFRLEGEGDEEDISQEVKRLQHWL